MATGGEAGHLHPERSRRSRYQYFFYDKHHGRGGADAAQWSEDLSEVEEFLIFDQSDELDLSDEPGNLYGLRIDAEGELLELGTLRQQVAKFPFAHPGQPWHGYPLGPLLQVRQPAPPIRPLPRDVLRTMERQGLLNPVQRRRLEKGKQA